MPEYYPRGPGYITGQDFSPLARRLIGPALPEACKAGRRTLRSGLREKIVSPLCDNPLGRQQSTLIFACPPTPWRRRATAEKSLAEAIGPFPAYPRTWYLANRAS